MVFVHVKSSDWKQLLLRLFLLFPLLFPFLFPLFLFFFPSFFKFLLPMSKTPASRSPSVFLSLLTTVFLSPTAWTKNAISSLARRGAQNFENILIKSSKTAISLRTWEDDEKAAHTTSIINTQSNKGIRLLVWIEISAFEGRNRYPLESSTCRFISSYLYSWLVSSWIIQCTRRVWIKAYEVIIIRRIGDETVRSFRSFRPFASSLIRLTTIPS